MPIPPRPLVTASEVRSACPYCGVGCGILATVHGGRVTALRGDPDHPSNRGRLCGRGQRLAETLRTGDRLRRPLRRALDAAGGAHTRKWSRSNQGVSFEQLRRAAWMGRTLGLGRGGGQAGSGRATA